MMAIIGLGTDIVEIERLGTEKSKLDLLANRILTSNEIEEYENHAKPERFLAKKFASKEATVKALGTGVAQGVSWKHIEISHTAQGAPQLTLLETAHTIASQLGVNSSYISIADERHYAVATVILSR